MRDIEVAEERYSRLFGISAWLRYRYDKEFVPVMEYRGSEGDFSMRVAAAGTAPQIELIEPLGGPSVYHEHLETQGEGLHHIGVFVPSLTLAIQQMAESGYFVIQAGTGYGVDGDGGFAYFDTVPDFGIVIEAIEVPRHRRPPLAR